MGYVSAARQFLVTVTGLDDFWATKTGGDTSSAVTDVFNGGQSEPSKIAAPAIPTDVVVTRPYEPDRDQPVVKLLTPLVGRWRTTVSVQPTDADMIPIGDPGVYAHALLVSLKPPDVDASSGKEAVLSLTFAVGRAS